MARLITGAVRITSNKGFGPNTEYVDNDVDVDDVDDDEGGGATELDDVHDVDNDVDVD